MTARGIYLAQDRTDIQFAVKELSRRMSKPTVSDMEALKHNNESIAQKLDSKGLVEFLNGMDAMETASFRNITQSSMSTLNMDLAPRPRMQLTVSIGRKVHRRVTKTLLKRNLG